MWKVILSTILLISCATSYEMILDYKDVQFFEIIETKNKSAIFLKISGLAFHSSMGVERIEKKIENNSEIIFIYLTPIKKGLSGNFLVEFSVPSNIDQVKFGPTRYLIWERGIGPIVDN